MWQSIVIALLTEVGSDPFDIEKGTTFMVAARRGAIVTDEDVATEFSMAASEVVRNLKNYQTANVADDEKLLSLDLLSYTVNHGILELTVRVVTAARDTRAIILPISVPIGKG